MAQPEPVPRQRRHRTLPPPPEWLREHTLVPEAGASGLPDEVGFALFVALRDLKSCADALPEERPALLGPPSAERQKATAAAAEQEGEIAGALETISTLRISPETVTPAQLGAACREIHGWADERGLTQTALLFAEAGARVDAENSTLASAAGRAARRAALLERADLWYERGVALAARYNKRGELIRALIGRGALMREQARFREAKRLLERAASLAAATRRYRQAAEVQHELLIIAAEAGGYAEAERHMRAALRHYPIHHPSLLGLIHDWCFVLVRYALYEQALPLLDAVLPQIQRPEVQTAAWGILARAAAGAGRRDRYYGARDRVLSHTESGQEFITTALANIAEGARLLGEWEFGTELATRAVEIARARNNTEAEQFALKILAGLSAQAPPPPQAVPSAGNHLEAISRRIAYYLQARQRPARRPVQLDGDRVADRRQNRPSAR